MAMFKKESFILILVILIGCSQNSGLQDSYDTITQATPRDASPLPELEKIEVRDYEGKDLSSISDFRENSIKGPQYVDKDSYELSIEGLVENKISYTYDDVLAFQKYSKVVTLYCVEGWDVTIAWEGVLVKDLLQEAGLQPEAITIIFYAVDGYSTALALDYILDNNIMLAYKMNNVTLPPERGFPFQLVAEEKWGYKWIKWVTKIELSDNPNYRGFWEQRGYDQKADVGGPILESQRKSLK